MHADNETKDIGGLLEEPSYEANSLVTLLHLTYYILAACRLSSLWYTECNG